MHFYILLFNFLFFSICFSNQNHIHSFPKPDTFKDNNSNEFDGTNTQVYSDLSNSDDKDILKEIDELMIELVGLGWYNTNWSYKRKDIYSTILIRINDLHEKYPDSEWVNYLAFLILDLENNNDIQERINLIKNNISNEWFRSQAFLISGDNYSDNEIYELAKRDYKQAIRYASSNAQKGYCHYKLGNIYFQLNSLYLSLQHYVKADELFNYSKAKQETLVVDLQFKDWYSRNKIALYRVKNLLKK